MDFYNLCVFLKGILEYHFVTMILLWTLQHREDKANDISYLLWTNWGPSTNSSRKLLCRLK